MMYPLSKSSSSRRIRVEWFAGADVTACAFWPNEGEPDAGFGRYIVFDGQTCRISGKDRNIPVKINHKEQVVVQNPHGDS